MNNYLLDQSNERNGTSEYFIYWGDLRGSRQGNSLEERENVQRAFINGVDKLKASLFYQSGGQLLNRMDVTLLHRLYSEMP